MEQKVCTVPWKDIKASRKDGLRIKYE